MSTTLLNRLLGAGLASYAHLTSRTARFQVLGADRLGPDPMGRSRIVAAWHGMTMMMTSYLGVHDDPGRYVLIVPDDPRGEALSSWARQWGAETFTVSMEAESFVAARRLLALIRKIRPSARRHEASANAPRAKDLYLNPDGPDGPSHEPKDGVIFIARKTGAPIVPAGAFTATCYRVPRWDRYVLPFPYSRIAVVAGEPLVVHRHANLEDARAELRARLNDAELQAERLYRTGGA